MMRIEQKLAQAPEEHMTADEQNRRLQALVGELLKANQELRFKLASVEHQTECKESGIKTATVSAEFMF
jgi:hypothetical protein